MQHGATFIGNKYYQCAYLTGSAASPPRLPKHLSETFTGFQSHAPTYVAQLKGKATTSGRSFVCNSDFLRIFSPWHCPIVRNAARIKNGRTLLPKVLRPNR